MSEILAPNQIIFNSEEKIHNKTHSDAGDVVNSIFDSEYSEPSPTISPSDIQEIAFTKVYSDDELEQKFTQKPLPMERGLMIKYKLEKIVDLKRKELESLQYSFKNLNVSDDVRNVLKKLLHLNYVERYNSYLKYYNELVNQVDANIENIKKRNSSPRIRHSPRLSRSQSKSDYIETAILVSTYKQITAQEFEQSIEGKSFFEIFEDMNEYQTKIDNIYYVLRLTLTNAKELAYEITSLKNYKDILNTEINFMKKLLCEIS